MNLGQQDYHVLTTLFQENLKESESYALMEGNARLLLNQHKSNHNRHSVGKTVTVFLITIDSSDNILGFSI